MKTRPSTTGARQRKTRKRGATRTGTAAAQPVPVPTPTDEAPAEPETSPSTAVAPLLMLTYVAETAEDDVPFAEVVERSPVPDLSGWDPEFDPIALRLDATLASLDEKIAALETSLGIVPVRAVGAAPDEVGYESLADAAASSAASSAGSSKDDERFEPDFVLTDEMLARAINPAIWTDAAASTKACGSAGALVSARRSSIDRARTIIADLRVQATGRPLSGDHPLEDHLSADARTLNDTHPDIAARIRFASKRLSEQAGTIEDTAEDARSFAGLVLDYVPKRSDRLSDRLDRPVGRRAHG